ncbi:MAG TPA: hypothetical protein V6C76_00560 [Drouetiella sp.]
MMDETFDGCRDESRDNDIVGGFTQSFAHTLIQGPIDGVRDIVNTCANGKVIPKVELVKEPERHTIGSGAWQAQRVGQAAGLVSMFIVIGNLITKRRPF